MPNRTTAAVVAASAAVLLAVAAGAGPAGAAGPAHTTRVSLGGVGEGNDSSFNGGTSHDGRWITFTSNASNLVKHDINRKADVFVRDTKTGRTARVNVSSKGMQANDASYNPTISDDGRYVAYDSFANNLVPGDLNRKGDVFLFDRNTGRTQRISMGYDGGEANGMSGFAAISGDGRFVVYESQATNIVRNLGAPLTHLYVWDRNTGKSELLTKTQAGVPANGGSGDASMSRDGRFVAFASAATNLVPGDANQRDDIYVVDRANGSVRRVSMTAIGLEPNGSSAAPSISDDGQVVAFESLASNLLSTDLRALDNLGLLPGGENPHTAGDTNGESDIFVRDMRTGLIEMDSITTDGRAGTSASYGASISGDGTKVAFTSYSRNLAGKEGDTAKHTECFLRDRSAGKTTMISVDDAENAADNSSSGAVMSSDGDAIVFSSYGRNLVRDDRNEESDVFLHR